VDVIQIVYVFVEKNQDVLAMIRGDLGTREIVVH
jgi:hypothetical protein